MTIMLMVCRFF